ncbi:MAG TPA: hypothetical protein VFR47_11260 [Anaerolineales bacterium]|nr:hypothetical protein [Anaerolineales bacterium]
MKIIQFFMPRIEYVLFAAMLWGIASTGPLLLNSDGDLPRHLLVGKLIRATHEIHLTDIFSYRTEGVPSIPHEWLAQVILSGFYDALDLGGIVLFAALIVTVTWAFIYYESLKQSGSLSTALIFTGLGVGASLIHILPRPHLFSHLFTALWILTLQQIQKDKPQRWWILPVLMLAWVNLHGMFVLGIVIWIIYLAGSLFENSSRSWMSDPGTKSMLMGGALSFVATFLSPSGLKIWEAIASLGGNAYIKSRIPEYQSPNFQMAETWPFILLLLFCIASFARSTRKIEWTHVFLVTAFAGIALYSSRMLPLFAIVAVPVLAKSFSEWLKEDFPNNRFLAMEANISTINRSSNGWIWVVVVVLAVILLFRSNIAIDPGNKGNVFDPNFFPVEAVNWLDSHPQSGHMFNEFDWGGYILLKLWPTYPIFMDGHTHIYGEALTREYEKVITLSKGWEGIFKKYQIEWAIVRADSKVANALQNDLGWKIIYRDNTTVIVRYQ